MATPSKQRRITVKTKHPNPLFEKWLTEWRDKAKENDSKMQHTFNNALKTLKKYPLPLESGRDCVILKGFGNKLCEMLDKKLREYKTTGHFDRNDENLRVNPVAPKTPSKQQENKSPKGGKKPYKPGKRTGGYAILLGMLKRSQEVDYSGFMYKDEIITYSRDFCDKSFIKPEPGSFYTAWSSMSTLVSKGFVEKKSSPAKFSLTDAGEILAVQLHDDTNENNTQNNIIAVPSCSKDSQTSIKSTTSDTSTTKSSSQNSQVVTCSPNSITSSQTSKHSKQNEDISSQTSSEVETILFAPGTFDIILLVDTQETAGAGCYAVDDETISELNKLSVNYEVRHLKVGDFTWIARDRSTKHELVLPYIVERKRMDDLGKSIKDGRFHEQKFRLKQCGIPNVMYIVESYKNNTHTGLPLSSLMQAATNTSVQDKFQVKFTENHRHSMQYLSGFCVLLTDLFQNKTCMSCPKDDLPAFSLNEDLISLMTFKDFNKNAAKARNFKVYEIFIRQLLQFKGVSVEKAIAIVDKYPSPKLLKQAYDKVGKNGEKLLANIQYGALKRSIGPAISQTIFQLYTMEQFP